LQGLQDPSKINGDNLHNIRLEAGGHFRKKEGISESKIDELATKSNYMNTRDLYRRINEFRRGYQPRSKSLKG
jgi:hypothetical protein